MPEWMERDENYIPETTGSSFAEKSTLTIVRVLSRFRTGSSGSAFVVPLPRCSAPLKLLMCLLFIVLVSCARNMLFCYAMLLGVIVMLCLLPSRQLLAALVPAVTAAVFSAVILIPAIFMGSPQSMLTISIKVFISVSIVGLLASTTGWNRITGALRAYRVPSVFIFTLDMTLKYIAISAGLCLDLLDALKLRSVGRPETGQNPLGGILGVTFLRTRRMSEETMMAMECRGFSGEYPAPARRTPQGTDILYALLMAAVIFVFYLLHTR